MPKSEKRKIKIQKTKKKKQKIKIKNNLIKKNYTKIMGGHKGTKFKMLNDCYLMNTNRMLPIRTML